VRHLSANSGYFGSYRSLVGSVVCCNLHRLIWRQTPRR